MPAIAAQHKIESKIPMPTEAARRGRRGYWKPLAEKMKKGDSILVEIPQAGHPSNHSLIDNLRRLGYETRVEVYPETGNMRVWRAS